MFELQKKQRELNRTNKLYSGLLRNAEKSKTHDEVESLAAEMFMETGMIEEEIKSLVSRKWIQRAERLLLPVPSYDEDNWEKGTYTQLRFLTPQSITYVRSLVREELSAQRKAYLEWVAPLIGVIGAVTGLVAVLFK